MSIRSIVTVSCGAIAALISPTSAVLTAADVAWTPTTWNGERAQSSESGGWRAVVSLERARLVHFGPADSAENLIFAPAVRGENQGWGGHIVWLGPQAEWPVIWPPDAAWERSGVENATVLDGWLTLAVPSGNPGWAGLVRSYRWHGDALHCRVELHGGARAAQVIQIVQVPASAIVQIGKAAPFPELPHGFATLKVGAPDQVVREFEWPAQAARQPDGTLMWHPTGSVIKVAFKPQALLARLGAYELVVDRAAETGAVNGLVDAGLNTQLYLGREGTPFIELEQLSARFAAGATASAEIVLRARKVP